MQKTWKVKNIINDLVNHVSSLLYKNLISCARAQAKCVTYLRYITFGAARENSRHPVRRTPRRAL